MKKKYLKACIDAGLTKDEIKRIDRIFDADKKRRYARNKAWRESGLELVRIDRYRDDDPESEMNQIEDPRIDLEAEVLHRIDIEHLKECLAEMPKHESELLIDYYAGTYGIESFLARKYGMNRLAFRRYRISLEQQLKEKYEKKFGKI